MASSHSKYAFWRSTKILLRYKRFLVPAMMGAFISSLCFGIGIASLLPVFHLLLNKKQTIDSVLREQLARPGLPEFIRKFGTQLADALPTDPLQSFVVVMCFIAGLAIIGSTARYVHTLLTMTAIEHAMLEWRSRLFRRYIHVPLEEVLQNSNSSHISRLLVDARMLSAGYLIILGKATESITKGLAAGLTAIILSPPLAILVLAGATVIGVLLRKFGKRIRRASRAVIMQRGRIVARLHEALHGIRVVKVHSAEAYEHRRFRKVNRAWFREEMRMRQVKALSSPLVETLALIGVIIVATIAAWFIFRHGKSPSEFMTVLIALAAAGSSLKPLSTLSNQLYESTAAAERIEEALEMPVEPTGIHAPLNAPALGRHQREVKFDDVCFRYPSQETDALHHVSLTVPHGKTIALVGGNGSGKTTLMSLLPRLLNPSSGRVLIDGVDIAGVRLRSLRNQIAVVTQDAVLFQGSIAQNILYGRRSASREEVIAAAKIAHAHTFIEELPDGYDSELTEGGEGLSGGQRQRICLARAILRDPSIFIFDEATSQIDADSEAKISAALKEICRNRTTFIIAHRLSTVVDADLIVVMDHGQIISQGTHRELLEQCDIYRALTHAQLQPTS